MLFATNCGEIIIEDDVLIASGVKIHVNNHRFLDNEMPIISSGMTASENVLLRKGCWIGTNSVILPGVTIGVNAVVAAVVVAAVVVVTEDVECHTVVGGVPAKVIKVLK